MYAVCHLPERRDDLCGQDWFTVVYRHFDRTQEIGLDLVPTFQMQMDLFDILGESRIHAYKLLREGTFLMKESVNIFNDFAPTFGESKYYDPPFRRNQHRDRLLRCIVNGVESPPEYPLKMVTPEGTIASGGDFD